MHAFSTTLVPGRKAPYSTWTFIELPADVEQALGPGGPRPVRGTLAGTLFHGNAARGEGVVRVPVTKELMEIAGVAQGDTVAVELELDPEPRPVTLPPELALLLEEDAELAAQFARLPPSQRRAWAAHIADAKRSETRARRVAAAPAGIRSKSWPR